MLDNLFLLILDMLDFCVIMLFDMFNNLFDYVVVIYVGWECDYKLLVV